MLFVCPRITSGITKSLAIAFAMNVCVPVGSAVQLVKRQESTKASSTLTAHPDLEQDAHPAIDPGRILIVFSCYICT